MLTKMVLNHNDYTKTMIFDNAPIDIIEYYSFDYIADENNMRANGVITYNNDRITVYERPIENKGCNDYDNTAHCIAIACELDDITNGYIVRCSECGEWIMEPDTSTDADTITLECGCEIETIDADDLKKVDVWDYFNDHEIYDIEYRIDSEGRYRSAHVMIACGGPNIYIDTKSQRVELNWWGDEASASLSCAAVEMLDEYFEELYSIDVKGAY